MGSRGPIIQRSGDPGGSAPTPSGAVYSNGVDNITQLSALDDTLLTNGTVIGVSANLSVGAPWMLNKTSVAVADGITIAVTLSGVGRWERDLSFSNPQFAQQATWFVNNGAAIAGYGIGNDENTGLVIGAPLATVNELDRRLAGHAQEINQATVIKISSRAQPETRLRISVGPAGTILIQGTATTTFTSNAAGFSVVTNINHAVADGAGYVTDPNLPVSWTASGLVGQRIRTTPAIGTGAQSWVVFDAGARRARVAAWIQPESAYPYALFYAPVNVAVNDPYVIESLTTFTGLHLEVNLTQVAAFAYPQFVLQDISVTNSCQIQSDVYDEDPANVIGCNLPFLEFRGGWSFYNCRIPGPIHFSGGIALCSSDFIDGSLTLSAPGSFAGGGSLVIDGDTIVQGGGGFLAYANCTWGAACVYGSSAAGVNVQPGATITIEDQYLGIGAAMYGTNNTTYGIRSFSGSQLVYVVTKPVITGTTNDTIVGGTAYAYAAVPVVDAAQMCGIMLQT